MQIQEFTCKFYDKEFKYKITSEYPYILKVESNLSSILKGEAEEFQIMEFQGNSNRKKYKEYTDKKGTYIKFNTGTSIKPGYIKIYKPC